MKILFLSYGNSEYDGRQRELLKVCQMIGDVYYVTRINSNEDIKSERHYGVIEQKFSYIKFFLKSIKVAKSIKDFDILFIDNRRAVLPGFIIKWLSRSVYIVQDVRELYITKEIKHVVGKIGCFFEQKFMKKVNLLISANEQRANIMEKIFNVNSRPISYENVRRLNYSKDLKANTLSRKYESLFQNDTFKIISTAGCSVWRTNDKLVEALKDFNGRVELFLVGDSTKRDKEIINNIIDKNNISGVHILSKKTESELKYLISKCDAGVVNYNQRDTNNRYCASGKIYEFIFEGKPVITTDNPPLVDFCNKYQIGISGSSYSELIREITRKYSFYKTNAEQFGRSFSIDENNNILAQKILTEYKRYKEVKA
jgi:glycosyltransferase involved in cell wall biosynthesis